MKEKIIITILGLCLSFAGWAQTSASPDTVCAGETGVAYWVTNTAGSTYNWTVDPGYGTQATGGTTNSITIDWGMNTGLVSNAISVVETDANGCIGDPVYLDVFISPIPNSNAGADKDTCGLIFNLEAVASVGTGTWTSSDAGAVFVDANDPNTQVTASGYGAVTFTWTENNNGCTDSDDVVITFIETPTANAGADDDNCGLTYTLAGTTNVGSGQWSSTDPSVSFSNASSGSSNVTVTSYATYSLVWTATNGSCTSTDTVEITFYEQPSADAGTDDNVCGLSYALSASTSVGTGTWTASAPASFSNANDPNATATVSSYGPVTFTWTEGNGGCSSSDDVVITFVSGITASAGADDDACALTYTLSGNSPGAGTGTWTSSDPSAVFSNLNDPNSNVTVTSYGAKTFTWTITNVSCSSADAAAVTFREQPAADAGPDDDVCGTTYTLAGSTNAGTGTWTSSDPSAVFSNANDPNATVTVGSTGSTVTFTWSVDNGGGCVDSDGVDISFNPPPTTGPIMHN